MKQIYGYNYVEVKIEMTTIILLFIQRQTVSWMHIS